MGEGVGCRQTGVGAGPGGIAPELGLNSGWNVGEVEPRPGEGGGVSEAPGKRAAACGHREDGAVGVGRPDTGVRGADGGMGGPDRGGLCALRGSWASSV